MKNENTILLFLNGIGKIHQHQFLTLQLTEMLTAILSNISLILE